MSVQQRQGGRIVAGAAPALTGPPCDVCGADMIAGQTDRHYVCSPPMECCGYPSDLVADKKSHAKQHEETDR